MAKGKHRGLPLTIWSDHERLLRRTSGDELKNMLVALLELSKEYIATPSPYEASEIDIEELTEKLCERYDIKNIDGFETILRGSIDGWHGIQKKRKQGEHGSEGGRPRKNPMGISENPMGISENPETYHTIPYHTIPETETDHTTMPHTTESMESNLRVLRDQFKDPLSIPNGKGNTCNVWIDEITDIIQDYGLPATQEAIRRAKDSRFSDKARTADQCKNLIRSIAMKVAETHATSGNFMQRSTRNHVPHGEEWGSSEDFFE